MDTRELNGKYIGKVIDGGLAKAGTGSEQVALLCELGGTGPEKGTRLTFYGYFSEKAFESTIKSLRAAGWQGTDLAELDNWKATVPSPPDVEFVIQQEEQQDSDGNVQTDESGNVVTRARVRWINALGALGVKERLAPDEAKSFAARMKGKLLAFDQNNRGPKNNGAPARQQQRPTPPATTGGHGVTDDIPF